jgi:ABC-2 type transport system ATP-binding protein
MPVVETRGLVKRYKNVTALKGVTLTVERGQIFGLLGRNGAGKTTLVKILLSIVRPTEGTALLLDQRPGTPSLAPRVGYLPEDHRLPEYHTPRTLLDFYGALVNLSASECRRRIPPILELVGLAKRATSKIRTFSKGMKQRLGLAQALMHEPEALFLDEPTDGVDPVGRREIRDVLQRLRGEGKTIFLNSHLLGEVEMICDRVAILERGELVREGDVAGLTREKGRFVLALAPGEALPGDELRQRGYEVQDGKDGAWEIVLADGQSIDPVVEMLVAQHLHLRHLVEKRQTLEDIFLATIDAEPGSL